MNDDRERVRRLVRNAPSVHPRAVEDLRRRASRERRGQRTAPALGLALLTVLLAVTATVILSRIDPPTASEAAARSITERHPNHTATAEKGAGTKGTPQPAVGAIPTATVQRIETPSEPQRSTSSGVIALVVKGSGLAIMNTDGSRMTALIPDDPNGGLRDAAWSPDGERIAFSGPEGGIWVIRADGSGAKPLSSSSPNAQSDPAWSPDGRYIAYTETRPIGQNGIVVRLDTYLMRADGSGKELLARDASDPAWSPNGKRIAYIAPDEGIHVMNADGSGAIRLAGTTGADLEPAWSPDGTRIAFTRRWGTDCCDGDIHLMRADGTGVKRLTTSRDTDSPSWAPDSSRLVFDRWSGPSAEVSGMYAIGADGDGEALVHDAGEGVDGLSDPAWSPAVATIPKQAALDKDFWPVPTRAERTSQFLRLNGLTYQAVERYTKPSQLGPEHAAVRRAVPIDWEQVEAESDFVANPGGQLREGDSTLHAAGTKIYRLRGYQPEYKLAAYDPDEEKHILVYEPEGGRLDFETGADLFDLRGEVQSIDVMDPSEAANEGALAEGSITDPVRVRRLVEMVLAAPKEPNAARSNEHQELYVAYTLRNGTVMQPELHLLRLPPEHWRLLEAALPTG